MTIRTILIILAVLYTLSPYDFIPDFLAGWGWLDDLVILGLLWRYLRGRPKRPFTFKGPYQRATRPTEGKAVKDPYTILGIGKDATKEEIKRAYRKLANKYHPDKVSHLGEEFQKLSEKRFIEIQEAYRILEKK
jgi:DnaJ like chaperone protein